MKIAARLALLAALAFPTLTGAQPLPAGQGFRITPRATVPPGLGTQGVCDGSGPCLGFWSSSAAGPNQYKPLWRGADNSDTAFLSLAGGSMAVSSTISFPGAYGSHLFGQLSPDSDSTTVFKFAPTEAAADPFYINFLQSSGGGLLTRNDQIAGFGWNLNRGGGLVNSGVRRGAIGLSLEQYWEQAPGDTSTAQMEAHLLYVDPTGAQHRPWSLLAGLNAPYTTGFYIFDDNVVIGAGPDNNSPGSITVDSTRTFVQAPAGYNRAVFDDTGSGGITLQVGSVAAGANVASIVMSPSLGGGTLISGGGSQRIAAAGHLAFEANSQGAVLQGPSNTDSINVGDGRVAINAGGAAALWIQAGATYSWTRLRPIAEKDPTRTLGASGGRWGYVAVSLASTDLPSCDVDIEGAITVVPAATNVASSTQACMKNASNAYAWTALGGGGVTSLTGGGGITVSGSTGAVTLGASGIAESAITSLVSDLAAKLPLAGGTMTGPLGIPANMVVTGGASLTNTVGLKLVTNVADGASSVGTVINNTTSIATASGRFLSIQTGGVDQFFFGQWSGGSSITNLMTTSNTGLLFQGATALYTQVANVIQHVTTTSAFKPQTDFGLTNGASNARWSETWSRQHAGVEQTLAAATSITINPALGERIRVTLATGTAITTVAGSAGKPGERIVVEFIQDATGNGTVAGWSTSTNGFKMTAGFTASTGNAARSQIAFTWDATDSKWIQDGAAALAM